MVSKSDAYFDKKDGILARRKKAKQKTLQIKREHNRKSRELDTGNLSS